jgi:hypothetical protein
MSDNPLSVRAKVAEIDVYDAEDINDDGRAGHVNVRCWLERGDEILGVADARIYFKRTDISLDDLRDSAIAHAHHVLSQIAENLTTSSSGSIPERLWVE